MPQVEPLTKIKSVSVSDDTTHEDANNNAKGKNIADIARKLNPDIKKNEEEPHSSNMFLKLLKDDKDRKKSPESNELRSMRRHNDLTTSNEATLVTENVSVPANDNIKKNPVTFKSVGKTVTALVASQKRSAVLKEKLIISAYIVGGFLGTTTESDKMWKNKWDKAVKKGQMRLPHTQSPNQTKDDVLCKMQKTVMDLCELTEIDDGKLIEEITKETSPIQFYSQHACEVFRKLHQKPPHPIRQEDAKKVDDDELLSAHDAYEQYNMLIELERNDIMEKLQRKKEMALAKITWQERMLDNVKHLAQEYFRDPNGPAAKDWKAMRMEVNSSEFLKLGIQHKLAELPTYFPFFTVFIIAAQLVAFIVIASIGGITTIGANPVSVVSPQPIKTLLGVETLEKWVIPNMWIGPDYKFFIGMGAVYAPCMRSDNLRVSEYLKKNYTKDLVLGCCEVWRRNLASTTTQWECKHYTSGAGNWTKGLLCSKRKSGRNSVAHEIRPCCLGSRGQCVMMTHSHCKWMGGTRSPNWEHCSTVNCLSSTCGMGSFKSDRDLKWKADNPNQWWRFLLAILYHPGIIQCLLVLMGELALMRQLEAIAGWLRVMIIYIVCCFVSFAAAAGFEPYSPHMGGVGALSGIVGVSFIEMLQSWPLINKPWLELVKFLVIIIFMLLSGTLPFLSIYSIVFGFFTGIIVGVITLPYITFGKWSSMCRVLLLVVAFPLLIIICIIAFITMYNIQVHGCEACDRFNCVRYTDDMCDWQKLADLVDVYLGTDVM